MKNWESLLTELARVTSAFIERECSKPEEEENCIIKKEQVVSNEFDAILSVCPFVFAFGADTDGNGRVQIKWPTDIPKAAILHVVVTILAGITKGNWQPIIAQAIMNHGVNTNQSELAELIVQSLVEQTRGNSKSDLCVDPTSVFKANEE